MKIKSSHIWSIFLLFAWTWCQAAPLSYPNIKRLYNEGELEKIKVNLEAFLKENARTAQPNDKVFAYKYLGVIYATEPQSYPVAESYFYQMLKLAPNAHLSDLYVSSAVQSLFEKTQERFRKDNRDISEYDEFGNPRIKGGEAKGSAESPGKKDSLGARNAGRHADADPDRRNGTRIKSKTLVWPWVAGGVAIAAVGAYFWFSNQEKGEKVVSIQGPNN